MDGVYDLDNDDLVEFLAFEENSELSGTLSRVAYYEIDDLGFPQLIWNIDSPQNINGEIVDVRLADLNGSGTYELFLAANIQNSENSGKFILCSLHIPDDSFQINFIQSISFLF